MSSSSPEKYQTPPPKAESTRRRHQREGLGRTPRRLVSQSSSSPTPSNSSSSSSQSKPLLNNKTVYLIRHGESLGQIADRRARTSDPNLTDCGLSPQGQWQAQQMIPELLGKDVYKSIDLVVSSPLTRALQTAVSAFPDKRILVHYQLREIGSMIPENIPRNIDIVLTEMKRNGYNTDNIDATTLRPDQWPRRHDTPPKVVRRDRIRQAFAWMWSAPELANVSTMAVVCHYHVIRAALIDDYFTTTAGPSSATHNSNPVVKPHNAIPIKCRLGCDGRLTHSGGIQQQQHNII